MRRIESVILAFVLLAALGPAGAAGAASPAVSGTIVTKDKIALTPAAVAVVTIVDQDATGTAGSIIGQQRIDGAAFPVSFSVAYDAGAVDEGRSYALFASVVDGGRTYQSVEPVPVITGGPTSGVTIQVAAVPSDAGRVAGSMVRNDRSSLSTEAVAIAALIRQDTGTMVARQVIPNPGSGDIAFAIPYDPGIIDPEATYVVRGGIVDGERRWGAVEAVEAIVSGAVAGDITVELTQVAGPAPTATPRPTATAKPTPEPTPSAEPTARPTAAPTATTAPTASPAPTRAPTPTPSPTPSPSPSPTPSPSATASPEPTPSPTPNATAVPEVGVVRGTLTYGEDHELTAEAQAIVVLVAGAGSPEAGSVVASTVMDDPGAQPVDFELLYPLDATTAGTSYYLWGGIADGDLAWVTPIGVAVKAPWPLTEGVELPLEFRPDLLKAAVSGSITGVGLVTDSPAAYATALIVHVETAEAIGFQFISPAGAAPIAFAVPYDPDDIDEDADYVVSGTVFDGTNAWHTVTGVPVITRGNAESGVVMPVVQAPPPPTPAPSVTAQPSPGPEPVPADDGGPGLVVILVVLGLVAVAGAGLVAYLRSRRTA